MSCKYGDPTCPCQDGDPCHYEGDDPMHVRPDYAAQAIGQAVAEEREACAQVALAYLEDPLFEAHSNKAVASNVVGNVFVAIRARKP